MIKITGEAIRKVKFDERYDSDEYETTTLYFIAPKSFLDGKYPEADSAEISIEFPTANPEPAYASVMMSPTMEIDCVATDYDWFDVYIPYDEIGLLIDLANKEVM